jgi:hypothetical protein
MRRAILASLLILAVCLVESLGAQTPTMRRGTRVRLTVPQVSRKSFDGVVESVDDTTLILRSGRAAWTTIPLSAVTRLEVSRARKRPMWSKTAPLWLTLSAGSAGALLSYATASDDEFFGRGFAAAAGGAVFGTLGLLVGTGMAIGVVEDVWEPVIDRAGASRASAGPSLYVAPGSRGLTLGVRTAF